MLFTARLRVTLAGLAVAGGAAAAAMLGPAGPAVGQSSPPAQLQIQVNSPATLQAKGASLAVSVTASCSTQFESPGFVSLSLSERVAGGIAFGATQATIDCTGTSQTLNLLVIAGSATPSGNSPGTSKAFARGVAVVSAFIDGCSNFSCTSQQATPTIDISK